MSSMSMRKHDDGHERDDRALLEVQMNRLSITILVLLVALGASSAASAQPGVQLDQYRPAATSNDGFAVNRPNDRGHLLVGARLDLDYALNPLVVEGTLGDESTEILSLVEHQLVAHIGVSVGLYDRFVVFAGLPINLVNDGDSFGPVQGGDGAGLGDLVLGGRARLLGEADDFGSLAFQLSVSLPLADLADDAQSYSGEAGPVLHPVLLGEVRPHDLVRVTANLGARLRGDGTSQILNLNLSHELTYALGFAVVAVEDLLTVHLEVFGAQSFENIGGDGSRESGPFEGLLGARVAATEELSVGASGGLGFTRGYGSPDFRGVFTVGWAAQEPPPPPPVIDTDGDGLFDDVDQCVDEPEDPDSYEDEDGCPDPDNDSDGVLDASDECPLQPETVNEHADEDGCPDEIPDTDGDGLRDDVDQCVDEPEDMDEFEDEDGCPDTDNDGDTVPDEPDRCPMVAGPPENRGCPDTDRDGDTVVDRMDVCPDEPGPVDNQGCVQQLRVRLEDGRIEILDRVFFRTDRDTIRPRSFGLLRMVALVLNNHPDITELSVEGHTDSRGNREHNLDLSQRRAESVMRFLVESGIDPSRMTAHGYGPDRPLVENAESRADHAQNRRVGFTMPSAMWNGGVADSDATADTIDR